MSKISEMPIRIVTATKMRQENFLQYSLTGKSIKSFFKTSEAQVRLYAENSKGLSEVYNKAIDEALGTEAILVFMHDDVLIADYFWADRVRTGLQNFDIVGIAGNSRRIPGQPMWSVLNMEWKLEDKCYLSGAIGQGVKFPPEKFDVFGPPGVECKLLDGVFLATTTSALKKSKLRFDPNFTFHFYDLDFCRSAEKAGLTMGTIPLSLVHASGGQVDSIWKDAYDLYINKWGH